MRAVRVAGAPTGRIGVLVEPGGERSFVQDRGAALRLRPQDLKPELVRGRGRGAPPGLLAARPAAGARRDGGDELARDAGALVTLDLSSTAPLLAKGRRAALELIEEAHPDLIFATRDESRALVGSKKDDEALLELAPIAVVKRGRKGATILARDGKRALRFEVATTPIKAADTTGAGDAFSAGFLHGWLDGRRKGLAPDRGAPAGRRRRQPGRAPPPVEPAGRAPARLSSGIRAYARTKRSNQSSIRVIRSIRRSGRPVAWYTWYSSG